MLGGSKMENLNILVQEVLELCPTCKMQTSNLQTRIPNASNYLISNGIGTKSDTVVKNYSATSIE